MANEFDRLDDIAFAASPRDHAKDMIEQVERALLDLDRVTLGISYSVVQGHPIGIGHRRSVARPFKEKIA
jgi:hypothetical protein